MKCIRLLSIFAWKFAKKCSAKEKSKKTPNTQRQNWALMRKSTKLQKKIQRLTNHQTKENVLNQIKEIENKSKIWINTERTLRETRAVAVKKKILLQIRKKQLKDQSWNWTSPGMEDPTMTIKYPKDFFGHLQANTLSDINITWEHIIAAIKSISQNSSGGPDEFPAILLKQCSKRIAHPLQLLYKASLKRGEIPIYLNEPLLHRYSKVAPGTFPNTTVL